MESQAQESQKSQKQKAKYYAVYHVGCESQSYPLIVEGESKKDLIKQIENHLCKENIGSESYELVKIIRGFTVPHKTVTKLEI